MIDVLQEQKEKEQKEQKDAPAWKEFTAPDGRKYYYNRATKQSSWTVPDELKEPSAAAKASPNPAAGSVQVGVPLILILLNSVREEALQ